MSLSEGQKTVLEIGAVVGALMAGIGTIWSGFLTRDAIAVATSASLQERQLDACEAFIAGGNRFSDAYEENFGTGFGRRLMPSEKQEVLDEWSISQSKWESFRVDIVAFESAIFELDASLVALSVYADEETSLDTAKLKENLASIQVWAREHSARANGPHDVLSNEISRPMIEEKEGIEGAEGRSLGADLEYTHSQVVERYDGARENLDSIEADCRSILQAASKVRI